MCYYLLGIDLPVVKAAAQGNNSSVAANFYKFEWIAARVSAMCGRVL
jgi:hypothetical protein